MKLRYSLDVSYENNARIVDILVMNYAYASKIEPPTKREIGVLRDYVLYGYSGQIKDVISANLGITKDNLNVINSNLEKKGYLVKHPTNQTMRKINKDLEIIKETVKTFTGKGDCILIKFSKGEKR